MRTAASEDDGVRNSAKMQFVVEREAAGGEFGEGGEKIVRR